MTVQLSMGRPRFHQIGDGSVLLKVQALVKTYGIQIHCICTSDVERVSMVVD